MADNFRTTYSVKKIVYAKVKEENSYTVRLSDYLSTDDIVNGSVKLFPIIEKLDISSHTTGYEIITSLVDETAIDRVYQIYVIEKAISPRLNMFHKDGSLNGQFYGNPVTKTGYANIPVGTYQIGITGGVTGGDVHVYVDSRYITSFANIVFDLPNGNINAERNCAYINVDPSVPHTVRYEAYNSVFGIRIRTRSVSNIITLNSKIGCFIFVEKE